MTAPRASPGRRRTGSRAAARRLHGRRARRRAADTRPTVSSTEPPSPAPTADADLSTEHAGPPPPPPPTRLPIPTRTPVPTFDARDALADIETLADDIGPREATSKNFDEAADLVEKRFEKLGYDVDTEKVTVPAGNSWGTPVRAGTSRNVIADPDGFDDEEPHVVVVAHLDTVPVAPGAEDNASGISVLLELARMAAAAPPELPVRFIAFGAEEPRGCGRRPAPLRLPAARRRPVQGRAAGDPGRGGPGPGRRAGVVRAGLLGPRQRQRPAGRRPRRRPARSTSPPEPAAATPPATTGRT